ncbi:hypothetical protein ABT009_46155 [Streptomyces sp. NPDC002896]|uniref:hypothetical protein n=1 Tax=Streptomyces sp. NPDC002896 TaxID=3154438 RepID=UPI00332AAA90
MDVVQGADGRLVCLVEDGARGLADRGEAFAVVLDVTTGMTGEAVLDLLVIHDPGDRGHSAAPLPPGISRPKAAYISEVTYLCPLF